MIWRRPGAKRLVIVAALLAVMPDIDAIGRPFGFGDIAFLGGHRAVTHSVFAALIAGLSVAFAWRSRAATGPIILAIFLYVTTVVFAHGVLDTTATYGDGVAFLAPFSAARYSAPWQPFTGILFEIAVLWTPAALMLAYMRRAGLFGEFNRSLQLPTREGCH